MSYDNIIIYCIEKLKLTSALPSGYTSHIKTISRDNIQLPIGFHSVHRSYIERESKQLSREINVG